MDKLSLSPEQYKTLHQSLCRRALRIWQSEIRPTSYRDSIAGISHELDLTLPADAYVATFESAPSEGLAQRYLEPLSALQDEDLLLPHT